MAFGGSLRGLSIVLHDDSVSEKKALVGADILPDDGVGYLTAPSSKALCVSGRHRAKNADEVSIHMSLAGLFGFENRMIATLQVLSNPDDVVATHVELLFRDQYLSQADMWRVRANIQGNVICRGQKLCYLGFKIADVTAVYIAGTEVDSALVERPQTKLIFRSGSARFTVLIQISRELLEYCWQGDLMYERLIRGFLQDLFQRWETLKMRHCVSVVLFGRCKRHVELSEAARRTQITAGFDHQHQENDFFRVVTFDTPSANWRDILRNLRRELNDAHLPRDVSVARQGNMLEAIYAASADFAADYQDLHLASCGTSIIAVTAGNGLFQTDHELLRRTTQLLLVNGIAVDVVSLSPKPLHPVPLFQYSIHGHVEYALPHWIAASYWSSSHDSLAAYWTVQNPPEDLLDIALPPISDIHEQQSVSSFTSKYDNEAFEHPTVASVGSAAKLPLLDKLTARTPVFAQDCFRTSEIGARLSSAGLNVKRIEEDHHEVANTPGDKSSGTGALPPRSLLLTGRKISLGPKGLALSQGVATTTLSHAQHEREPPPIPLPASQESPSLLTQQIRASLKAKHSQRNLMPDQISKAYSGSQPIDIHTPEPSKPLEEPVSDPTDPANVIERAVMEQNKASKESSPMSMTPKGKRGSLPLEGLGSHDIEDESHTPWLTLLNPCNPRRDNMRVSNEYRQWQHASPRTISSGAFKWDSMCRPACLPLFTEVRVSTSILERHFERKVRRLLATPSSATNAKNDAEEMMRHMVALRLAKGFQILPDRKPGNLRRLSDRLERTRLALGGVYHDLECLSDVEVQVTEYERKVRAETEMDGQKSADIGYRASVRAAIASKAYGVDMSLKPRPSIYDWSSLDDQCVNRGASGNALGLCRIRYVLIPVALPHSESSAQQQLSDEERRIDGIQKLTLIWQRQRFFSNEEQQHRASMIKPKISTSVDRDPNPLAIEYQTTDPTAVVGAHGMGLKGDMDRELETLLFPESEMYHTSNFDIAKLATHLQESPPNGVELRDRRWFTKLHLKCFRGDEMTNWLLRVFKDLKTRDDAVALGNQLMNRQVFTHVRGKHVFRDGNYFYQIKSGYRTVEHPDTTGLFSKSMRSVPPTPMFEQRSPGLRPAQNSTNFSEISAPADSTDSTERKEKKEILLTQKLQYNVDPHKKSDQTELVNLHYDRIHNPGNCYHIQLDFVNTTPKLIRESVTRWAHVVEGHGLRLVQLSLREACKLWEQHPFEHALPVKLAVRPRHKSTATSHTDEATETPLGVSEDRDGTHKALLRKLDFVLDLEAAHTFPSNVDVAYSWGRPDYTLTQFVHRSGRLLVQISNDATSDFLMLPNRHASSPSTKRGDTMTTRDIAQTLEKFCRDPKALKCFYEELEKQKSLAPSPFVRAASALARDVPPFELPSMPLRPPKSGEAG